MNAVDPPATMGRREMAIGFALSAAVVPLSGAACSVRSVPPSVAGPTYRTSGFTSFAEAAERWGKTGGTLMIDRDHVERKPVTIDLVPDLEYRLTTDGARTLRYAGPQFHWFLCLRSRGGNPLMIDGGLTIDGGNACSMPMFVRFEEVEGDRRRALLIDAVTVRNARMRRGLSPVDGSRTNLYGATGMAVSGGFDTVVLRHISVYDITREAGAGIRGHQGSAGLVVSGATDGATNTARHVTIEDFLIERIDSDEPAGSPARGDMDGIIVFQGAQADGTAPLIQRGTIREAAGRAVKIFAPGGGGTTRDLVIHRAVHGNTGGSNDIAHQHGDGLIEDVTIHYSGDAHSQPTVPVGMSSGTARHPDFPFQEGVVRRVVIRDTTGQVKRAVATFFYNVADDDASRRYRIEKVTDQGSAECLLRSGVLGTFGTAEIIVDDVSVRLTTGLVATEDKTPGLKVRARRLVNHAKPVPFKVAYNGDATPPSYGGILAADATVYGVMR